MIMKLWIARDENGELCLFDDKPTISVSKTRWLSPANVEFMLLDSTLLPEVTFENSPQKVRLELVKEE